MSLLCGAALIASVAAGVAVRAQTQDNAIPNFTFTESGWLLNGGVDFRPIPGKVPPVTFDPAYPQRGQGNQRGVKERMSDTENPNVKPWAQAVMKQYNQGVLEGHRSFSSQSRCWPGGVPGQLLYPFEPFYAIQTPKEVWLIWQRDHMVRRIFLTDKHSPNVKLSWFGESIGHYENGDTLVVDTIGLSTQKNSYIDNFRTPHSEKLHVVERFTIGKDAKSLTAVVKVEDPDTFNAPLTLSKRWFKVDLPMIEVVCSENNDDHFNQNLYPIPQAEKPDF